MAKAGVLDKLNNHCLDFISHSSWHVMHEPLVERNRPAENLVVSQKATLHSHLNPLCLDVFEQRHSEKVFSGFRPELGSCSSASSSSIITISGSHGWGVEEGVMGAELYRVVAPEVEAVESR